ncbi:response regulator transcription factor [Cohnella fermenti]|uniref:Response regulator n=1 Tax=Cohnella fermenti TaxID=2565925 RepID=A0A4S4BI87_9BACL|nr:response regulator [Cohnella fermenti]THF74311.1 response regulator [Cohnella fermenti]
MIRVMIVEDDVFYRRSFRSMLDWESLGFVVCGECMHGKDALQRMTEAAPDIVFTDISMPTMNGIELIRTLKREYPRVRIIVLSSFDDFDFVKEAMKLGADDYLLKHELGHSMDSLLRVLEELKAKMTDASEELFDHAEARQLILDALMNRIVIGRMRDRQEIERHLRRLTVYFPFERYMLAVIVARRARAIVDVESAGRAEWQADAAEALLFRQAVLDMGDRPASSQRLSFLMDDSTGVCLFNLKGVFSQSRMQEAVSAEIRALFGSGMELCVGVSGLGEGIASLPESYNQAHAAAGQGLLYARQALTLHTGLADQGLPNELLEQLNKLEAVLDQDEEEAAEAWSRRLAEIVYAARLTVPGLEEVCELLNRSLKQWTERRQIKLESITRYGRIPADLLALSESKEVLAAYLSGCLKRALALDKLVPQTGNPRVRQAVEFIGSHYPDPIGLREVSRALDISENYLSNLFKQETGRHFVDYLNEVRLHHAKRLAAVGNLKVSQIARQCGFLSDAYFCRLFKEKTGMSPTEYRRKVSQG